MCPNCRQSAPLIYKPDGARCSACGTLRLPLTQRSLTFAGESKRLGGSLAVGLAWTILGVGMLAALGVTGLGLLLWGTLAMAKFVALPLAVMSALIGGLVMRAGSSLKQRGGHELRGRRVEALRALAAHQGGAVTVQQAATALHTTSTEADALLTELAVAEEAHLEVTDDGKLLYYFQKPALPEPRVRVARPAAPSPDDDDLEELHAIVEPPLTRRTAR